MAQGNHFLTIPKQEAMFTTIKNGRAGQARDDSPVEDEDEEETEEDVRFIPRSSPIPRKRGPSITDETAEYMRIHLALDRRVSFADASGGELVDVREFAAFASDDEEDNADWEEEEAKCRRAYQQPVYRLWPEFQPRDGHELTLAVCTNKVEVEKVTLVEHEPLCFDALICVLNVSYHKAVYVRSTMDGWMTHTDSAAHYVPGSHHGDTDHFSARLSFAEPYLFTGARIDFVVRYETSDGEFWANNSGRNYSVTLVVSYEEDASSLPKEDGRDIKGILKPRTCRAEDDSDFYPDTEDGNENNTERGSAAETPSSVCPLVIEPEIDIEIPEALISPSENNKKGPTIAQCPLLSADRKDEHVQDLSENPTQTDHLEKRQGMELLKPTESIPVSIQSEAPGEAPSRSTSDRHYAKSNLPFSSSQDNPQPETVLQAPIDLSIQNMKQNNSEEDYHGENDEIQPRERGLAQPQDPTSDTVEIDNTESSLQELQESAQHCYSEELFTNVSKGEGGQNSLFEELENPEMQMINPNSVDRIETRGKELAGLREGEISDMTTSCMRKPFEATILGQPIEESVIQHVPSAPRTPDHDITEDQQKGHRPESEMKAVPEVLSINLATPSGLETLVLKEDNPILTSFSSAITTSESLTTTVQTVAPEDGEHILTQKESLSKAEHKLYSNDPDSFQKPEGFENQPALPSVQKTSDASNVEVEIILSKALIPSFVFLSATVCLLVGFHEPSLFLIMAVFLFSLCF